MTVTQAPLSQTSPQTSLTIPNEPVARAAAQYLLRSYGVDSLGELALEDVALAENVLIVESPLESADAWLVRSARRGIIRIRSTIPEAGRKRFAVAHELGHWFLHKEVSQLFACTSEDLAARYRGSPVEIEANLFASELLMPTTVFVERTRTEGLTIPHIERLAAEFQTSFTATALRFVECTTTPCALICSRDDIVRWWIPSPSFAERCGMPVGKGLSGVKSASRHEGASTEQSLASLYDEWNRLRAVSTLTTPHEEILPMPEYGQKLHLVRFKR